jgi:hypothetical protein
MKREIQLMKNPMKKLLPLAFSILTALTITGCSTTGKNQNQSRLFNGKTLDGWIDQENGVSSFSGDDIKDFDAFAKKLTDKPEAVSAFLNGQLDETNRANLADYSATNSNAKVVRSALVKNLNKIISGDSIYDETRFKDASLRPETKVLLAKNPQGFDLARLNKMLIADAYPAELAQPVLVGWTVTNGALASTGIGRGTLYTTGDYGHFRLTFLMRHISGKPDHPACILFFCRRPLDGQKPVDALGGIQFMLPNGSHWDYRPTENGVKHNNDGGKEFTTVVKGKFNVHEWSQIEIIADAATGTARLAVAQPPGSKAIEILDFKDPTAGRSGPIALQMHNAGLFDEYKDFTIEVNPKTDDPITTK